MAEYKLSEQRVRRVLHAPLRIESGIADETIGVMQRAGSEAHPYEIWVLIQDQKDVRAVISAWRYPGVTKPGDKLPFSLVEEYHQATRGW